MKIGWDPNPEVRVSGYNVYRSTGASEPILLNPAALVGEARFVDRTVEKGVTYTYVVTAVDFEGLESVFSDPLTVKVEENRVPAPQTVFLPASLATDQPAFQNTFVGLGLLNLGDVPDQASLIGIDDRGSQTGYRTVAGLMPHGKASELPDQIPDLPASTTVMLGQSSSDVHPFFLAGTKDLKSFEGITEKLEPSRTLYFPISLSQTGAASLALFNPEQKDARIEVTAWSQNGSNQAKTTLVLPPLGSFQGVLPQLFGPDFALEKGYVVASSDQPVEGYEISAFDSQSLSGLPGEPACRGRRLSLPHFFFDDSGGDTEIQIINVDPGEIRLEFTAHLDGVAEPEVRSLRLGPQAATVISMRALLGREGIPGVVTGNVELTATGRDGAEAIYAKVVAQAAFIGNGGRARAVAPLRGQGAERWIFPAVLQQRDAGFCTGLVLVNPRNESLALTLRAVDDQGHAIAERTLEVPAGQRLVGQLDSEVYFGPGFAQLGGHLEVTADLSFMALAFFGDQWVEFLSHIGPVLR
ncbi:MAG: fibronectin type III domain-containing protein [Acidobacteriota bacterium]